MALQPPLLDGPFRASLHRLYWKDAARQAPARYREPRNIDAASSGSRTCLGRLSSAATAAMPMSRHNCGCVRRLRLIPTLLFARTMFSLVACMRFAIAMALTPNSRCDTTLKPGHLNPPLDPLILDLSLRFASMSFLSWKFITHYTSLAHAKDVSWKSRFSLRMRRVE
jgi:hypothetical protein